MCLTLFIICLIEIFENGWPGTIICIFCILILLLQFVKTALSTKTVCPGSLFITANM